MRSSTCRRLLGVLVVLPLVFVALPAEANHSWGGYHWDATTLPLGDNVSSAWDAYLAQARTDWNGVGALTLNDVAGATSPKNCRANPGRIEVCNSRYGNNGWLGIAQIWISGGHITQAVAKMNDTYFSTSTYNTPAWRLMVMCQEIAHDFGLDHQDETFDNANVGSCMDYTNDPDGGPGGASSNDPSNEHPNVHDDEQLTSIYAHVSTSSAPSSPSATGKARSDAAGGNSQAEWGTAIDTDGEGRPDLFVQELPDGTRLFTHVFWTLEHRPSAAPEHTHD